MAEKITQMWIIVGEINVQGMREAIPYSLMTNDGVPIWHTMMCTSETDLPALKKAAQAVAMQTGQTFRLVRLGTREDLDIIRPFPPS